LELGEAEAKINAVYPQISEKSTYFHARVEDQQENVDFLGDRAGITVTTSVRREGRQREARLVKRHEKRL
jgi:hypothetical protein